MVLDTYSGLPLNICKVCNNEFLGYVDLSECESVCESCENKNKDYGDIKLLQSDFIEMSEILRKRKKRNS